MVAISMLVFIIVTMVQTCMSSGDTQCAASLAVVRRRLTETLADLNDQRSTSTGTFPTKKVAFHSSLSKDTSLGVGQTVIFDDVITNVGKGYNNVTGIFTAPVDGVYVFMSTFIKTDKSNALHLLITKNKKTVSRGHATYGTNWNEGSMNAVLELSKNDKVEVSHFWTYGREEIMNGGWCFFSGYLIA